MADKVAQSDRIAAEMRHTPSAEEVTGRAASVVGRYRLQADDLPGGRHTGQIHSINTQGVEALKPLAFITGLTKPLALSEADVQTLVRLSNSPFSSDWIGRTVEVRVVRIDGDRTLRLYIPGAAGPPVDAPPVHRRRSMAAPGVVLVIIAVIGALLIVFAEQIFALWALLEQTILALLG